MPSPDASTEQPRRSLRQPDLRIPRDLWPDRLHHLPEWVVVVGYKAARMDWPHATVTEVLEHLWPMSGDAVTIR